MSVAGLARVQAVSNAVPTGQSPKSGDSGYANFESNVVSVAGLARVQAVSNAVPTGQSPKSGDSGYANPVNFFSGISSSGDSIDATGKEQ